MEGQEKNTAQLAKIGAIIEQRWGLAEENKKEDRDYEEGSKNGPRKGQREVEEETLSSISY